MDYQKRFRVKPGSRVRLDRIDPGQKQGSRKSGEAQDLRDQGRLNALQRLLYASTRHSLLIVLQGMDTGGKDGTISHVLGAMNPQGCRVQAFREPSPEEAAHDFLWRAHRAVPARGEVVVFNRSHYEAVLVERVHKLVPKSAWSRRYALINGFEAGLAEHGTLVLKFFLHISKEEQLRRFKHRLDDPERRWKISESDYIERERWDEYMAAYEDVLSRCSTEAAPWYMIPADHKWSRNLAISRILVQQLEALKMSYPEPTADLEQLRRQYQAARKRGA